jgi:hypothetical protein
MRLPGEYASKCLMYGVRERVLAIIRAKEYGGWTRKAGDCGGVCWRL